MNQDELDRIVQEKIREAGIPPRFQKAKLEDFPKKIQTEAKENRQGLFIAGPVGSGKSHLLASILIDHLGRAPFLKYSFVSTTDLLHNLRSEEFSGTTFDTLDKVKYCDALYLDDFAAHTLSPWKYQELFTIINHRYAHMLPTWVTSNSSLQDLYEGDYERLASRFSEMCKSLVLDGNDKRAVNEY